MKNRDDVAWNLEVRRRIKVEGGLKSFYDWRAVEVALTSLNGWPDDRVRWLVDQVTDRPAGEAVPEIMIARTYHPSTVLREAALQAKLRQDADELEAFFVWIGAAT